MRLVFSALVAMSCGEYDPCDGVRDLGDTPLGLELTAEEHPGWGHTACLQCHSVTRIHRYNCMSVEVDVAAIEVDLGRTESCVSCHGTNGVAEWEPATNDSGAPP